MTLHSFSFLCLFLPVALVLYYHGWNVVGAKIGLLVASLGFYASLDARHLPLLLLSLLINYGISLQLLRTPPESMARRRWFQGGLAFNLGLLLVCKYTGFFLGRPLFHSFPLGISFFTIQEISFLVDVHQGLIPKVGGLDHALFVSFFPRVTSGPILDYRETLREFSRPDLLQPDMRNLSTGLMLLFMGLGKKLLIADTLAGWVKTGFAAAPTLTMLESWMTALCFTFQLYFDFSGYSDMAVGVAQMFNIHLPQNFNSPYKATSIIDFWNRWHITLTRFITSYLYTPLIRLFEPVTFLKSQLAIFITMVIAGWWHGPAWTFVLFGALHGVALVLNHAIRKQKWRVPDWLGWLGVFGTVNVGFVFFRASSVHEAWTLIRAMVGLNGWYVLPARYAGVLPEALRSRLTHVAPWHLGGAGWMALAIPFLFMLIFWPHNSQQEGEQFHPTARRLMALVLLMFACLLNLQQHAQFVYVNF